MTRRGTLQRIFEEKMESLLGKTLDPDRKGLRSLTDLLYQHLKDRGSISGQVSELEIRIRDLEQAVTQKNDVIQNLRVEIESSRNIDEVSGLLKRNAFLHKVAMELSRSLRYDFPVSLVLIRFDHLDQYTLLAGRSHRDEAFRAVSRILNISGRRTDVAANVSGDEVGVLLTNTSLDGAVHYAERVRKAIEQNEFPLASRLPQKRLTVCLGVAEAPENMDGAEAFIELAAEQLRQAQSQGENQLSPQVLTGRITLS